MSKVPLALPALLALLLVGCGQEPAAEADPVIAHVNGAAVYASELAAAGRRTFAGQQLVALAGDDLQSRLLDSLIASRVMAQQAQAEMSAEQLAELERDVDAWREEQLVKRYLASRVQPEPVSDAMVEDWYRKHPQQFGGGTRHHFEQLSVRYGNDTALRDRAIDALASAGDQADWRALARQLTSADILTVYQSQLAGADFADQAMLARLSTLDPGESSPLSSDAGVVSVVRLQRRETIPPRPLIEVRNDIRRQLAPVQLRHAVKTAMDEALAEAEITYPPQQPE